MANKDVYLRSDKHLSVNCDVDSNPEAICEWLINDEIIKNGCNTQLDISNSSLVKCKAKNSQYKYEFDEENIKVIVVANDRKS